MKKVFFITILFFTGFSCFSQTGTIIIHDSAGANALVEKHIHFNKEHNELPGWRIQVFSTNSLVTAKDAKASFMTSYDEMDANIVFEAPNYKLRIGNYQNRFDANRDLQELIVAYPNAFICRDIIKINDH